MKRWVALIAFVSFFGVIAYQLPMLTGKAVASEAAASKIEENKPVKIFSSLEELKKEEARLRKEGKKVHIIHLKKEEEKQIIHVNPCREHLGKHWTTVGCWDSKCICIPWF